MSGNKKLIIRKEKEKGRMEQGNKRKENKRMKKENNTSKNKKKSKAMSNILFI